MSTGLIPQTPKPDSYATGLASFVPSSRAVARATRRRTDAVLGRAEVTHARDQARAVLAAGALNNTAALVGLAEQAHQVAPAGDPYYQAIIRAYALSAAQDIAEL